MLGAADCSPGDKLRRLVASTPRHALALHGAGYDMTLPGVPAGGKYSTRTRSATVDIPSLLRQQYIMVILVAFPYPADESQSRMRMSQAGLYSPNLDPKFQTAVIRGDYRSRHM